MVLKQDKFSIPPQGTGLPRTPLTHGLRSGLQYREVSTPNPNLLLQVDDIVVRPPVNRQVENSVVNNELATTLNNQTIRENTLNNQSIRVNTLNNQSNRLNGNLPGVSLIDDILF